MRVLGIDPGFGRVGLGCVDGTIGRLQLIAATCIETDAGIAFAQRLLDIHHRVGEFLDEHSPDVVSIEKLFFATNRTTAMNVSEARGVIILAIAERNIPYVEYSPPQIKNAVTGYGEATKQQVSQMVRRLLAREAAIAGPDDVTDALAIAVCHHHTQPLARSVAQAQANVSGRSSSKLGRRS